MKEIKEYLSIYRDLNEFPFRYKVDSELFLSWMKTEFDLKSVIKMCGFKKEEDFIRSVEFACKHF